jgi:hypothetical protein
MLLGFFWIRFFKIHRIHQKASYLNIMFMEVVNTKQDFEFFFTFSPYLQPDLAHSFYIRSPICLLEKFEKTNPCKSTFLV